MTFFVKTRVVNLGHKGDLKIKDWPCMSTTFHFGANKTIYSWGLERKAIRKDELEVEGSTLIRAIGLMIYRVTRYVVLDGRSRNAQQP